MKYLVYNTGSSDRWYEQKHPPISHPCIITLFTLHNSLNYTYPEHLCTVYSDNHGPYYVLCAYFKSTIWRNDLNIFSIDDVTIHLDVENPWFKDSDRMLVSFFIRENENNLSKFKYLIKTEVHVKICFTFHNNIRPISAIWSLALGLILKFRDVIQILPCIILYFFAYLRYTETMASLNISVKIKSQYI